MFVRAAARARAVAPLRTAVRRMFIQTESTPNSNSLKFLPGKAVLDGSIVRDFRSFREAQVSPLAKRLGPGIEE